MTRLAEHCTAHTALPAPERSFHTAQIFHSPARLCAWFFFSLAKIQIQHLMKARRLSNQQEYERCQSNFWVRMKQREVWEVGVLPWIPGSTALQPLPSLMPGGKESLLLLFGYKSYILQAQMELFAPPALAGSSPAFGEPGQEERAKQRVARSKKCGHSTTSVKENTKDSF